MLDHVGIGATDVARAKTFYQAALRPLNIDLQFDGGDEYAGFGDETPFFWIMRSDTPPTRTHVAFRAETRAVVDAFHREAIAAGGQDNGPPGLRPDYHPNYYAAFVIDPAGHNIEAVCHKAE